MGWSEWPSWLKGGIVISLIYLFCFIFYIFLTYNEDSIPIINIGSLGYVLFKLVVYIAIFPSIILIYMAGLGDSLFSVLMGGLVNFIFYFNIGALIGFIVGKIKSSREEK